MISDERYGPQGVQSGRYKGMWVNNTLGFELTSAKEDQLALCHPLNINDIVVHLILTLEGCM